MLTVPQADILNLITEFQYLRKRHVEAYIKAKYNSKPEHIFRMMKQLKAMGKIQIKYDYIMLPNRKMNIKIIKAFDMIMDLTNGNVNFLLKGGEKFIILFSVLAETRREERIYNNFGVIDVDYGTEYKLSEWLRAFDKELTVIFILNSSEQMKYIKPRGKHYFALQDENGKYKFFK